MTFFATAPIWISLYMRKIWVSFYPCKRRRECNPETGILKLEWRRRCAVYRRVQGLEEDLEKSEEKLIIANQKLDKVNTTNKLLAKESKTYRRQLKKSLRQEEYLLQYYFE
jgi:hypothetical protein